MLHILILVIGGFLTLAIFYVGAPLLKRTRPQGAALFMRAWLIGAGLNGAYGVKVGLSILNEMVAFVPIYGIPAIAAWWLAYGRFRGKKRVDEDDAPPKTRSGKTKLKKTRSRL